MSQDDRDPQQDQSFEDRVAEMFQQFTERAEAWLVEQGFVEARESGEDAEPAPPPDYFRLSVQRGLDWSPTAAASLISALSDSIRPGAVMALSLEATTDGISWVVAYAAPTEDGRLTTEQVHAIVSGSYPGAQVEPMEWPEIKFPCYGRTMLFSRDSLVDFDLASSAHQLKHNSDPLVDLSTTMSQLQPGEWLSYQILIDSRRRLNEKEITKALTTSAYKKGFRHTGQTGYRQTDTEAVVGFFARKVWDQTLRFRKVQAFSDAETKRYREKLTKPLSVTYVAAQFVTPQEQRLEAASPLIAVIQHLFAGGDVSIADGIQRERQEIKSWEDLEQKSPIGQLIDLHQQRKKQLLEATWFVLTDPELAALWHLPHKGFTSPQITWAGAKQVPAPPAIANSQTGIVLGENRYGGAAKPIHIHPKDRESHMIAFGRTGVGKSTFLHNLIHQDIQAGSGVAVIDPHADLVQDILAHSIPPEREDDVVVWDLADHDHPPPLNLFSVPENFDRFQAPSHIRSVFEKVYDGFAGTEMADTLTSVVSTLMVDKTPTLRDFNRLVRDDDYRYRLEEAVDDIAAIEFWEAWDAMSYQMREAKARPVLRRLRIFYSNPTLYPIMCHPQNLDLFRLMGENKIILVSLKPAEGDTLAPTEQQLLGALFVSQFEMAAMAGACSAPYYLYIDEAQHLVATSLKDIFNEARKRQLRLILSNQYLGQLAGDTLDAVMGNVGAIVSLACHEDDAATVSAYTRPNLDTHDLIHLDKYQAGVWMQQQGKQQPSFTINTYTAPTLGDSDETSAARAKRIRRKSVKSYTPMTKKKVLGWLEKRYPRRRRSSETADDDTYSEPVE